MDNQSFDLDALIGSCPVNKTPHPLFPTANIVASYPNIRAAILYTAPTAGIPKSAAHIPAIATRVALQLERLLNHQ